MKNFKKGGHFGAGNKSHSSFAKPFKPFARHGDASRPAEMHSAKCAHCGKICEVPFRPNGKKPVFCKDCFVPEKGDATPRTPYRSQHIEPRGDDLKSQIEMLNTKIEKLMRMVEAHNK